MNLKYTILVIDDDKELCALITQSVLKEKINADYCYSGTEGWELLEKNDYQRILLDVMMPGMDGFQTMKKIRVQSSIPILMLTSKNDSMSKVQGLRSV